MNDQRVSYRWRTRGAQISPSQFQESVAKNAAHFVGDHALTGSLVAYASLFSLDLRAQHAQIGLLSSPELLMTGLGIELGAIVAEYAFSTYPLRKLYLEIPDFNRGALEQVISQFAVLEAELPEHVYWDGALHSTLMFSVNRSTWFGSARVSWERLMGRRTEIPETTREPNGEGAR